MEKIVKIIQGSKLSNLSFITFYGLADGSNLNKTYNINNLLQNYLKIKYIDFSYFTDSTTWVQKAYYDNNAFTPNANTRYDLLRPYTKIDLIQHEAYQYQSTFNLFFNGNKISLFPNLADIGTNPLKLPIHLELDAITDVPFNSTIDFQANITLLKEFETPNFATPIILISMLIEKLGNEDPFKSKGITNAI